MSDIRFLKVFSMSENISFVFKNTFFTKSALFSEQWPFVSQIKLKSTPFKRSMPSLIFFSSFSLPWGGGRKGLTKSPRPLPPLSFSEFEYS